MRPRGDAGLKCIKQYISGLVRATDHARKEIRDMIDATLSAIVREHAVDESFVINEIKDYLSGTDACRPEKQWFEGDSILTNKSAQERRFWLGRECNSFESAKNQWDSPCALAA